MRFHYFRIATVILAFLMFSMAACQFLQAQAGPDEPTCHGKSEPSPEPKSDSSIRFCCEAGLIPNTNKTPICINVSSNLASEKFQILDEHLHSQLEILTGYIPIGPAGVSSITPLRI